MSGDRFIRIFGPISGAAVSTLLFVGILVVAVLFAERYPARWDLTRTGRYTLSQPTKEVLHAVDEDVEILAFVSAMEEEREAVRDLLEMYSGFNDRIRYRLIDPDRRPRLARRYSIRDYGTLVLVGFGKTGRVREADEESLTNALLRLMREEAGTICFLTGHGEHSLEDVTRNGYSSLRSALREEGYRVEELSLLRQPRVPEHAAAVVVGGPEKKLRGFEINGLRSFLERGGNLFVLLDPDRDAGLGPFLESYGIRIRDDVVIDRLSRAFGGDYFMPVITEYRQHPITEDFGVAIFLSEARSVGLTEESPKNVEAMVLASTSPGESWAETDREMLDRGEAAYDSEEDLEGPVPVAALAEVELQDGEEEKTLRSSGAAGAAGGNSPESAGPARGVKKGLPLERKGNLLAVGDSNFVDNSHLALSGNREFFVRSVNYLTRQETLVTIEPPKQKGEPLVLTRKQGRVLVWTAVVLMPVLAATAGYAVFRARRSRG